MSAKVLPDDEDIAVDPSLAPVLDEARRELHAKPEDHNDRSVEFHEGNRAERARNVQLAEARGAKAEKANAAPPGDVYDGADVPELKGKTRAEMVKEYRALHSQIGTQGHELGALRQRAQMLATLTRTAEQEAPTPKVDPVADDIEYFADPKAAIEKAVSEHPILKGLRGAAEQTLARKTAEHQHSASEAIAKEFPDSASTLADPKFRAFVEASPVRLELLKRAHAGYDVDAAREIFGSWKARQGNAAAKAAPPGAKPAAAASEKIYRRADVQKLMTEDPERYEKLAPEIQAAYRTGRVR